MVCKALTKSFKDDVSKIKEVNEYVLSYYMRQTAEKKYSRTPHSMVHFYTLKCEHRHLCMPSACQALASDPVAPILVEFTVQKRRAPSESIQRRAQRQQQ